MRRTHLGLMLFGMVMTAAATMQAQALAQYQGRPAFEEGGGRGYFVWRDGDTWHVRWTTQGPSHQFTGTVQAAGGTIESLKRVDLDEELRVVRPGAPAHFVRGPFNRLRGVAPGRPAVVTTRTTDHVDKIDDHLIRWTTITGSDIDGFDFKAKGAERLTFDLKIDGVSRAMDVEVGKDNAHPSANPFNVRIM